MMNDNAPTVIIGAGQAGLAMSLCLSDRGLPHVVLERGRIAERWRSERWDSFRLLSPNWQTRLPGHRYAGADPDGFMPGTEVVDLLTTYARASRAPVRTGVAVHRVEPAACGWRLRTSEGTLRAPAVVVATGDLAVPRIPEAAAALPPSVTQVHSSRYRNPAQLPDGAVLVVGAGPSGQQIALELARSGRHVHLAAGRHKTLPRRYRGQDAYWWMDRMGMLARTVDSLPGGTHRRSPNAVLTGGTSDLDLHVLAAAGVHISGRLTAVDDEHLHFADDLAATLAAADANADRFTDTVDAFVERSGIDAPAEVRPAAPQAPWAAAAPTMLDRDGIGSIVWATGFGRDFSWIAAPVLDDAGEPAHRRGVTAAPGLYFLGLRWQYRRSSSFLDGVGGDAEYLADLMADRGSRAAA